MASMNCIYALADPRDLAVRYVGKAKNLRRRIVRHLGRANLEKKRHSSQWLRNLVASGLKPQVIELETLDESSDWTSREIFWIRHYRDQGCKLTNLTDGGEGGATYGRLGKKNTPEHIAKSSHLGMPVNHTEEGNHNRAQGVRNYYKRMAQADVIIRKPPCSELRKQRIGNANRGRVLPVTDARLAAIERSRGRPAHNLGSVVSDETKGKIRASKKGKPWSDARKLAQLKRSPEYVE